MTTRKPPAAVPPPVAPLPAATAVAIGIAAGFSFLIGMGAALDAVRPADLPALAAFALIVTAAVSLALTRGRTG